MDKTAADRRRPFLEGVRGLLASRAALPLLFLLLVGPTILIQTFLTPPFQVPDEENHFLRAVQTVEGHLFGRVVAPGLAGGPVDPQVELFARSFNAMKFHPETKIDAGVYAATSLLRWHGGPKSLTAFSNTAIYPFFLYLPASTGLAVGRRTHLSVMDSFYLGRLMTAVTAIALGTAALWLCAQGQTLFFLILSLPMTTFLLASVSQDAMSIALGAVAAGLWSRYVATRRAMPAKSRALLSLILGAIIAARLPLLPLYGLALMPTRRPERPGRPSLADAAAALAGLVPLCLGIYGAHLAKVPFRADADVSSSGQALWILHHPLEAGGVLIHTLNQDVLRHIHDMIGTLGWLDTALPAAFYRVAEACMALALVLDIATPRVRLPRWRWLPPGAVALAVVGIFGALYLAWTPVGAAVVEGVQGRYLLVPALILAVALPGHDRTLAPRTAETMQIAKVVLCSLLALIELAVVPLTLIHRYHG